MTTGVAGEILLERDGRVAIVTFNRPEAQHAMTFEMYDALHGIRAFLEKRRAEWKGR